MKVKMLLLIAVMACLSCRQAPVEPESYEPMELLSLILAAEQEEDSHWVVESPAKNIWPQIDEPVSLEDQKAWFNSILSNQGYEAPVLIDAWFEANANAVDITLTSDSNKGYVVRTEKDLSIYLSDEGWDWQAFRKDHTGSIGCMRISLPVYDPDTKLAITMIQKSEDYLNTSGGVYAYRIKEGRAERLFYRIFWGS